MEKVKVTRVQADAIEYCKAEFGKDKTINTHAKGTWAYDCKPLNDLEFSELARALYIGYEVEPEFKAGDWVYIAKEGMYGQEPQVTMVTGLKEQKYISFPILEVDLGTVIHSNSQY